MKKRQEKEIDEIKECTFHPNRDNQKKNKSKKKFNPEELIEKLYRDGIKKIREKNSEIKKHEELEKTKEIKDLTIKPEIVELNREIFTPKNIKSYEISKKNVERFERARIEKKISEIQKQTGITNLNQINNIDNLLKENNAPSWNFGLEKKTYKDTFGDLSRFTKESNKNSDANTILNTLGSLNISKDLFNIFNFF